MDIDITPRDNGQLRPNVTQAISQIFAGVTLESAAHAHSCTVAELSRALELPETYLIEPTSEWDSVDLLAAEFRDTPDILAGLIPVGVTLVSAAPKAARPDG
jgi:hypothetical protein